MQFGIYTVGDVTQDPTNARTPSESERIQATLQIAQKAEDIGLDVFATGEHHNPRSSPPLPPRCWPTSQPRPNASFSRRPPP